MCITADKDYPKPSDYCKRYKILRVQLGNLCSPMKHFRWTHGEYNKATGCFSHIPNMGFHCILTKKEAVALLKAECVKTRFSASNTVFWNMLIPSRIITPQRKTFVIVRGRVKKFKAGGPMEKVGENWDGKLSEVWGFFKPEEYFDENGKNITEKVLKWLKIKKVELKCP